jgi:hypothetical protein
MPENIRIGSKVTNTLAYCAESSAIKMILYHWSKVYRGQLV